MADFDNVFRADISADFVEIHIGRCDPELLQKDDVDILDEQVENVKVFRFTPQDYRNFINMVVALGVSLQTEHGVDMGFAINDGENKDD